MLLSSRTFSARGVLSTCQECCRKGPFFPLKSNGFTSRAGKSRARGAWRQRKVLIAAGTGSAGVGAGAFLLADDARHYYQAVERSGRVVSTLYACINEYADLFHTQKMLKLTHWQ